MTSDTRAAASNPDIHCPHLDRSTVKDVGTGQPPEGEADATPSSDVEYASATGRWIVAAAVLGSGMAFLDGTVVNVALKTIGKDLGASLQELQWVSNAYLLALASLILLGGSLGDRFGRRKIFELGVTWFALASLLCGIAQSPTQLIAARTLQGVGGALLTPGSLAMIQGSFRPQDRSRAIGAWSGLGGIAAAIGPFLGGWLIEYASWRLVFLINLPLAVITVLISHVHVPETRDAEMAGEFDIPGAALATVGLAGVTFALVEASSLSAGLIVSTAAVGLGALLAFVIVERMRHDPMMPPALFGSVQFSASNAMTFVVYAALGAFSFFLVLQLQIVTGYRPLAAGIAFLPVTVIMLLLASRGGALAGRIGPRLPMALGPIVCAAGVALLAFVGRDTSYWTGVLPGVVLFGLGLVLLVAPLTATVLAAAPDHQAGIASGINNAIARAGSLLAVAALPAAVGLSGTDYENPASFNDGYRMAMWICVAMLVAGGVVSGLLIRNSLPARLAQ
jgi:EmrB/QacA subfamily drug resistance transporter